METPSHKPMASETALQDYEHRLVSLELTLQDAFRHGAINRRQYDERQQFIKSEQEKLRGIFAQRLAQANDQDKEINLGLPNLRSCTPEEREICLRNLLDRRKLLDKIYKEAVTIEEMMVSVSEGTSFKFLHAFKLSKLKKKIARLERRLTNAQFHEEEITRMIDRYAQMTQSRPQAMRLRSNLAGIVNLFHDLDQTSARIAELKGAIRADEANVGKMTRWLQRLEVSIHGPLKKTPPPPPGSQLANGQLGALLPLSPIDHSAERLVLARRYIESCASQTSQKVVSQAAQRKPGQARALTYFEALKSAVQLGETSR